MNSTKTSLLCASALAAVLLASTDTGAAGLAQGGALLFSNPSGMAATFSTSGSIDTTNPFFQSLGTNGRSCATCHQASDAWTVNPASIQRRFLETLGLDPIFRTNDGATSPNADVSTVAARRSAYSMLLTKGLIRVGIGIPADAEFELADVDDPYHYASASELSLFRRPLPAANLKFLSTVMWDGRETFADPSGDCIEGTSRCFASLGFDLSDQSNGATLGHAQASQALTTAQREAIVRFETGLYTAQVFDARAKDLTANGAQGGPQALSLVDSYFGINDVVYGDYRSGTAFDPVVFRLFDAWAEASPHANVDNATAAARRAVVRGQALFNGKPIRITGVKGINDDLGVDVLPGTCSTCHDSPGAGNHSIPAPLDIGIADGSRATPDMPLYVLRNKTTHATIATTDPGRALITGKWKDIGRFKGPTLRSLASRPPYFHNGSAPDLGAVVDFYNQRFSIGLTAAERDDLVAFLRSL
jgi:cytochrome c peroxidase